MPTPTVLTDAVAALDLGALAGARWFAGKRRRPTSVQLADAAGVPESGGGLLVVVEVAYADGGAERYLLPSRLAADGSLQEAPPGDPLWRGLARTIGAGGALDGLHGRFVATPGPAAAEPPAAAGRMLTDDQSNTSVVLDERLVVKCYRRLERGAHPEPELLAGLSRVSSRRAPAFRGSLALSSAEGEEALVTLYAYVPGEPVGWEALIEALHRALAAEDGSALDELAAGAAALGQATADLHRGLAAAFGLAPGNAEDARVAEQAARDQLAEAIAAADPGLDELLRARAPGALADLSRLDGAPRTRLHGDLHVGQFVRSPQGLVVVDFEGEPGRAQTERRRPGSPLRDLACLLLSLDHVACAAARRLGFGGALGAALAWSAAAREAALAAYAGEIGGSGIAVDERLLVALEVEKECRELIYAATVLPEWSYAPRLTLERLLGEGRA